MNLTEEFSVIDAAIRRGASEFGLTPLQARVALAISDGAGDSEGIVSDELEASLSLSPTQVRRALGDLYRRSLASGVACDGGPRRPGTRSRVTVTMAGAALCEQIHGWAKALREARAAELGAPQGSAA